MERIICLTEKMNNISLFIDFLHRIETSMFYSIQRVASYFWEENTKQGKTIDRGWKAFLKKNKKSTVYKTSLFVNFYPVVE